MDFPSTIYVAFGAVGAALVAGFFSFLNLVSAKENKVSEFRQSWIDGLREEIALHTSALQMLVRFRAHQDQYEAKDYLAATESIYMDISMSLTKIQLRLNPTHAKDNPNSYEAKLIGAINSARELLIKEDLEGAFNKTKNIRDIAALFLKDEWERVKNGEERYQNIRDKAEKTIRSGVVLLAILALGSILLLAIVGTS